MSSSAPLPRPRRRRRTSSRRCEHQHGACDWRRGRVTPTAVWIPKHVQRITRALRVRHFRNARHVHGVRLSMRARSAGRHERRTITVRPDLISEQRKHSVPDRGALLLFCPRCAFRLRASARVTSRRRPRSNRARSCVPMCGVVTVDSYWYSRSGSTRASREPRRRRTGRGTSVNRRVRDMFSLYSLDASIRCKMKIECMPIG